MKSSHKSLAQSSIHRKSYSSHISIPQTYCMNCGDDSKPSLDYSLCFSCHFLYCITCSVSFSFNLQKHSFCSSCFFQLEQRFSILEEIQALASLRLSKEEIGQVLQSSKKKSKECLEAIREFNLTHCKQAENAVIIERKIEEKLVKEHEKNRILEEKLKKDLILREELEVEVENMLEIIEKIRSETKETRRIIETDTEKILDLEEKVKEQEKDSKKINETLLHILEQKSQEIEVFTSTENLNSKLSCVRVQVDEAKKLNDQLRKRLQELKIVQYSQPHITFETRNENLKKMMEQYISQDLELQDLQSQLKSSSLTSKSCKCHIM